MNELDVVRRFEFDWSVTLSEVWSELSWDVPELHAPTRREFAERLETIRRPGQTKSPLGWVLVGRGGSGKTHLLGRFRHEAMQRKAAFVLVDMTDVRDFWETVLQGYLDSLQQKYEGEFFQHQCLVRNLIQRAGPNKPAAEILAILAKKKTADLAGDINKVLGVLFRFDQRLTSKYQDVVRALICLNSEDFSISSLGMTWLQGQEVGGQERAAIGFTSPSRRPIEIVEALSWFMSLGGPAVLAFDQIDAIVAQYNSAARVESDDEERHTAWSIIQQVGAGLGAIRDHTYNTLPIVSCLESSWKILTEVVSQSFLDRYESPPHQLDAVKERTIAEGLVRNRLAAAFRECRFKPPYATWPFLPEAFQTLATNTPREVLQLCAAHKNQWMRDGKIVEVRQFGLIKPNGGGDREKALKSLDDRFAELRTKADVVAILEERHEDERLAPLLQSAMQCLVHEVALPDRVGAAVETEFTGGEKTRALHVRLRLIFTDDNEREEHYCLRGVQLTNARAYQTRLKAAMTQSGIDRALKFRRLGIVRRQALPGGAETQKLTEKFEKAGGLFLNPTDDDIRTLSALHALRQSGDPDLDAWLRTRKPVSKLGLIREAVPSPLFFKDEAPKNGVQRDEVVPPPPPLPPPPLPPPPPDPKIDRSTPLPLGQRLLAGRAAEPVTMPVGLLEKHAVVLAGAGSGKTVLLKRIVEEAALLGVPSIVVDCANDLATLGEPWPTPPDGWGSGDPVKAKRFIESADVVVWTPGRESGNPLALEPFPDLAAVVHDPDELDAAVAMVRETLDPLVAPGNSSAAQNKQGILSHAIRKFAGRGAGDLTDFVAYLEDLPPELGLGVSNEPRLARQMADALRVARERNPLLRSAGSALDPGLLLGDDLPLTKTRVSVINLVGLPTLESQRLFLAQLAMTLFGWIKKNPGTAGRPLRGLLVIDEARDFVPSQRGSVCKEALTRLTAQARKYHLGVVFATQNPRDIDNKIISNCSTHFYGKVNSPASIDVVRELLRSKGGSGDDVARLPRGQFYVHNADAGLTSPAKLSVPLCLSWHRPDPLDETQVLGKAVATRAAR